MDLTDTYKLSEYTDLGHLDEHQKIRLARNRIDGRICVIRTVPADQREVYEQLRRLHCPQIPEIYELLPDENGITVIEEYIHGRTIAELLEERPFTMEEACRTMLFLCEGLSVLHGADPPVICRDLKAENIMIVTASGEQGASAGARSEEGIRPERVVIVDFDISRVYRPGISRDTHLLGTREYAAPEQYGFGQTDARTDLYAMGVLLNVMLLRAFPAGETAGGRIGQIVETCTRLDPDQRFQTAGELAEALREAAGIREADDACAGGTVSGAFAHRADGAAGASSWLLPGLRSRRRIVRPAALCGYVLLAWFCFTLPLTDDAGEVLRPAVLRMNQTVFFLSQLLWICLVFDFRGIRGRLPLTASRRRWVRLIGYVLSWIILLFLSTLLMVILEALMFP